MINAVVTCLWLLLLLYSDFFNICFPYFVYTTKQTKTQRNVIECFIFLFQTMVVSADQEGKGTDCNELSRDVGKSAVPTINTRRGGNAEATTTPRVIVDMREFRSELPALLHRRGIDIDPVTLQVTVINCDNWVYLGSAPSNYLI